MTNTTTISPCDCNAMAENCNIISVFIEDLHPATTTMAPTTTTAGPTTTTTTAGPTTTTTTAGPTTTTTTTTTTINPLLCSGISLDCRATISNDSGYSFVGDVGTNICHGVPVGASSFGNISFSCEYNGNYRVYIRTCFYDGSIGASPLGTYGFNIGTYLNISNAEKDVPLPQNPSIWASLNGRYLIVSQGPIYSVLQKISNYYP